MDEDQSQIVGICEQFEGANVFVVRSIAVRCAVAALSGEIKRINDDQSGFGVFKNKVLELLDQVFSVLRGAKGQVQSASIPVCVTEHPGKTFLDTGICILQCQVEDLGSLRIKPKKWLPF